MNAHEALLQQARARQQTAEFKETYRPAEPVNAESVNWFIAAFETRATWEDANRDSSDCGQAQPST